MREYLTRLFAKKQEDTSMILSRILNELKEINRELDLSNRASGNK